MPPCKEWHFMDLPRHQSYLVSVTVVVIISHWFVIGDWCSYSQMSGIGDWCSYRQCTIDRKLLIVELEKTTVDW